MSAEFPLTEYMVMAWDDDRQRYFYARETVPTESVELAYFDMAGYQMEWLVREVLLMMGTFATARWAGSTALVPARSLAE